MLIDTHCHLDLSPLVEQADAVWQRARDAGVQQCLTIGTSVELSRASVTRAQRMDGVHAVVGIHPHEADTVTDADIAAIDALANDTSVVAIGEIGLDYFRQHAAPEHQQRVFRQLLACAQQHQLPVVIHCRDAYDDLLQILREQDRDTLRGVIHCASGPPAFIEGALAIGFYVSFAGNVTFPKAEALRTLVPLVPDDRLLIETDAPYLAPQAVRGQTNEPAYVTHTAAYLAAQRGTSVETLARQTTRNARTLFGLSATAGRDGS